MQTIIKYIFLFFSIPYFGFAQGLEVQFNGQLDCGQSTYCVDIVLSSVDQTSYQVGASALFFNYNQEALQFRDYTPGAFSPDLPCFTMNVPAWEIQQYDAYSHPGDFHLVLQNSLENTSCPSIVNGHNLVIGTLCFDVLQEGGHPDLQVDPFHTSFNQFGTNTILPFLGGAMNSQAGDLACTCPGAGSPCDDQDIYTSNDQFDINCNCKGEYADQDQDGIVDGIDPCTDQYYEAEDAEISGPNIKNNRAQYYGSGLVDFNWGNNEYVRFTIDIATEGQYEINFRYALEGEDNVFQISVDGQIVEAALPFSQTQSWSDWQYQGISRNLNAGQHTIELLNPRGRGPNLDRLGVSICTDCEQAGMPCDDGDPCTIDDIIDANCNCGGRVVDEDNDQVPDICDPNVGDATTLSFETGLIHEVTDQWITVELEKTYQSMVVIATPLLLDNNQLPVVSRIQNAAGNSFQLKLQNPSGSSFNPGAIYYVVAEEGVYSQEKDGIKMEVRKDSSLLTANFQNWGETEGRNYQQMYQNPVVLGQVMSFNDPKWSVFWATQHNNSRDIPIASSLALGKNVAEDSDRERQAEVIGSIILEAGSYTIQNKLIEAQLGDKSIKGLNSRGYQYDLLHPSSRGAVLSTAGMEGGNGGWPVLFGAQPIDETHLTLVIDEDQIRDEERSHTSEQVAYLAFEDIICLQDSDGDTVCDEDDICPGFDDLSDEDGDGIPDGCDDCNVLLAGTPCDDGNPCTVLDRYTFDCGCQGTPMDNDGDGVCNWEDVCEGFDDNIDIDEDGIPDACDPNVGDATTFPIETGVLDQVSGEWITVPLARSFNAPIIVATPWLPSINYKPVVTRIRNVSSNSFDLMVQNPGGIVDTNYTVFFTAIEEGIYTQERDGVTLEARKEIADQTARKGNFVRETRAYQQGYNNPVVLGQVMSHNDPAFSVFWTSKHNSASSPPSSDSFAAGKNVLEDSSQNRQSETIGLIILEAGQYNLSGIEIAAKLGSNTVAGVQNSSTGYLYSSDISSPVGAILSAAGLNGGDGSWPILFGMTPTSAAGINLAVDEDQITDSERAHTTEEVAYLAFNQIIDRPSTLIQSATFEKVTTLEGLEKEQPPIVLHKNLDTKQIEQEHQLKLYPNPSGGVLNLEGEIPVGKLRKILITDAQGKVILTQVMLDPTQTYLKQAFNLSQLVDGIYFLHIITDDKSRIERFVITHR